MSQLEAGTRRTRITAMLSIAVGALIALLGLALVIGHFALNTNEDRWLEGLIEFAGIFAIGFSIVLGSIWDMKSIRWAVAANLFFWFALYSIAFDARDV